jgi:hypothetical protein
VTTSTKLEFVSLYPLHVPWLHNVKMVPEQLHKDQRSKRCGNQTEIILAQTSFGGLMDKEEREARA